jgi:hypothetical protein
MPTMYLSFLDDMLNVPDDGYDWGACSTILLVLQPLSEISRKREAERERASEVKRGADGFVAINATGERKGERE